MDSGYSSDSAAMRNGIRASAMRSRILRNLRRIPWAVALLVVSMAHISAGQQVDIQTLVTSGNLEEMRWPNFSDYRNSIQEFYEPTGFTSAWVQGSQPLPQPLSLIELFRVNHVFAPTHTGRAFM
jgi:hypothetical protein